MTHVKTQLWHGVHIWKGTKTPNRYISLAKATKIWTADFNRKYIQSAHTHVLRSSIILEKQCAVLCFFLRRSFCHADYSTTLVNQQKHEWRSTWGTLGGKQQSPWACAHTSGIHRFHGFNECTPQWWRYCHALMHQSNNTVYIIVNVYT